MSKDGQGTKRRRNIAENFSRLNRVQCTNVTDDRRTDDDIAGKESEKNPRNIKLMAELKYHCVLTV